MFITGSRKMVLISEFPHSMVIWGTSTSVNQPNQRLPRSSWRSGWAQDHRIIDAIGLIQFTENTLRYTISKNTNTFITGIKVNRQWKTLLVHPANILLQNFQKLP